MNGVDEIKIGNLSVWNFDRMKDKNIKSETMKARIEELVKLNLQNQNRPINDIGIMSLNNSYDFRNLSIKEIEKVREFQLVLFLASLAKMPNELGHEQITSDNFITATQNFRLESSINSVAVETGRILRKSDMGEIVFHKPHHINSRSYVNIDNQLIKSLIKLKRENIQLYRRIIRSIESIMNSYYNDDHLSDLSRILEISRAFEILFSLPHNNQRMHFKSKVRDLFSDENNRRRRYKLKRRNSMMWEVDIKHVMWADRFYSLRNKIIHGDDIKISDYRFENNHHFFIGIWFYLVFVKKIINNYFDKKIFYDTIIYNSEEKIFKYESNMILKIMEKHHPLLATRTQLR